MVVPRKTFSDERLKQPKPPAPLESSGGALLCRPAHDPAAGWNMTAEGPPGSRERLPGCNGRAYLVLARSHFRTPKRRAGVHSPGVNTNFAGCTVPPPRIRSTLGVSPRSGRPVRPHPAGPHGEGYRQARIGIMNHTADDTGAEFPCIGFAADQHTRPRLQPSLLCRGCRWLALRLDSEKSVACVAQVITGGSRSPIFHINACFDCDRIDTIRNRWQNHWLRCDLVGRLSNPDCDQAPRKRVSKPHL